MASVQTEPNQLDVTWKDAITEFIVPLVESVLPEVAGLLDTDREIRFLDKELHEVALTLKHGKRKRSQHLEVDLLVELPMRGVKQDVWMLLHIEVQGGGGKKEINRRMYEYHQLIETKYHKHVVGLLIATEPLKTEGVLGHYEWRFGGTVVIYQYTVVETYKRNEAELLESSNPFDLMQLAALRAWKARKNDHEKLEYAKAFVGLLRGRGYTEEQIVRLIIFMECITRIREYAIVNEYITYVNEFDEKGEPPMQMLIIEERALERGMKQGLEQGLEQGREKGKTETAKNLKRLGVDLAKIVKATGLTRKQVESL
ncbi:MAG: hypothetical protein ACRC46_08095 [Thermoguttaceae bacterium]